MGKWNTKPNEVKSGLRILIIGIYFSPELTGIGKYTGEMAEWFIEQGHECNIITGFPYYPDWKIKKPYKGLFYKREVSNDGKFKIYRCPLYVPQNPSGIKRVLQEFSFFLSALFVVLYFFSKKRNQYIFCISPPFHLGFLALLYRFVRGGKIVYHIQDLQIEAARDLKILKPQWIFSILFALERFILKRVDVISTISDGMVRKLSAKIKRPVILFPNWAETETFFPIRKKDDIKAFWGVKAEDKIILYSGGIGEKQGLESLLRVAKQIESNKNINIIICSSGPYKERLFHFAQKNEIKNVRFMPLQDKAILNDFLNLADIHLVLQKHEANDLVLPSKLLNILSVGGLAIVTANSGTTLFEMIQENNMGVVISPEDDDALKKAIIDCCSHDFTLQQENARKYAEKYLGKEYILNKMMQEIANT